MKIIIIATLIFALQVFLLKSFKSEQDSPTHQVSISMSASSFSFVEPEPVVDEVQTPQPKIAQSEGMVKKEEKKPEKKIVKKVEKKIKKPEKTVPKAVEKTAQKAAEPSEKSEKSENIARNNPELSGQKNANSLNNNASSGSSDAELALLINQLLNKYKKYPKRAKMLNLKGKVAGNFIISKSDLVINIIDSSHEIFAKETVQTIKKVKDKIPQKAYNTKISFVINYK